ncbi:MAG: DMT family transporter [Pseudomonadota bacterium]
MVRILILAALSLLAFAANSLLARVALSETDIGPEAFTLVRIVSGAIALIIILAFRGEVASAFKAKSWTGAAMLLIYALMFSFAYIALDTGTGALALFASVQITILCVAAFRGGLSLPEVTGAAIAFFGFVYLVWPTLSSPSVWAVGAMVCSGVGWGIYTLLGRGVSNPLALTAGNFLRATVLALPLMAIVPPGALSDQTGLIYAVLSGAITSGCGYAIWYAVVPRLTPAVSGVSQLLVPPIAAMMGWAALGEPLTFRLLVATLFIMGGLILVITKPTWMAGTGGREPR